MNWGEAFGRAFKHFLAWLGFTILFGGVTIGGATLIADAEDAGQGIPGIIIFLIGAAGLMLTSLAVMLKSLTDAIVDNVGPRPAKSVGCR